MKNFADKLIERVNERQNPSIVGLDPTFANLPEPLKNEQKAKYGENFTAIGASLFEFNRRIIDAVAGTVPIVKPQIAFYEKYGLAGMRAFANTCKYARKRKLLVIGDVKRNDIGSTAQAYSEAYLGCADFWGGTKKKCYDLDAVTVNAYLGTDGVKPFVDDVKAHGKGIFVLVKTSNKSSGEFQDVVTADNRPNFMMMAANVAKWGESTDGKSGYSSVGAVVGATFPQQAVDIRQALPKAIFLVPGYGAQGGTAADVVPCFNKDGYGAVVNSSRGIIFAYQGDKFKAAPEEFDKAAANAALGMKEDIARALREANIHPWK
jgi:orotidine-5'-phosphate decarboxylase